MSEAWGEFPAVIPRWALTCISLSLHFSFPSAAEVIPHRQPSSAAAHSNGGV